MKPGTCAHCKKPIVVHPVMAPGYHDDCAKVRISTALANEALEKTAGRPGLMRLRLIKHISFARSEDTNFEAVKSSLRGKLDRNDVVLFVSLTQNQIMFVYNPTNVEIRPGATKEVLRSVRFRLRGRGTWNPLMLANYAAECGLKLDGIKRFEEHYEQLAHAAAKSVAKKLGVSKELKAA